MPDSLKTSLALEDQLVQDPHGSIQVRVSDHVGVLWFFMLGWLGHLWSAYSAATWRPGG